MQNYQVFYNKEDLWKIASEVYDNYQTEIEPYYAIIKLPGEAKEEFLVMLPFTAAKRDNMIAWLAGRCDGENYGRLVLYKFSKDKLIYGPMQIKARADQNSEMSEKFTLWGQSGSSVLRGNLLVIPIENTFLYVEPIYLKSQTLQMPEIKKVIVAMGDNIEWGDNFDDAIHRLYTSTPKTESKQKENVNDLAKEAVRSFKDYRRLTGEGKLSEAGKKLEELDNILQKIENRNKRD